MDALAPHVLVLFREAVRPEDAGPEWAEFAEKIRFVVSSAEDGEELGDGVRRLLSLRADRRAGGDRRRWRRAGAPVTLGFHEPPLEAYEKLLLDVMAGDHTLFTSTDEVELLWKLCDPVLADPPPLRSYEQGSWGPQEALELPGPRGRRVADG